MSRTDERIERLERQLEMLLARVEALETENTALRAENADLKRRLGENSSNSSKPPSSDSPADRQARPKDAASGNPRGGQRGHEGHKRTFLPANRVRSSTECFPPQCRRCGDAEIRPSLDEALELGGSGYRFVGDQLVAITDEQQITEIEGARAAAAGESLAGVREHLDTALILYADRENPDHRNSIKESISAWRRWST